jgi:hypothetical protein
VMSSAVDDTRMAGSSTVPEGSRRNRSPLARLSSGSARETWRRRR